jgi:hypothetical protein
MARATGRRTHHLPARVNARSQHGIAKNFQLIRRISAGQRTNIARSWVAGYRTMHGPKPAERRARMRRRALPVHGVVGGLIPLRACLCEDRPSPPTTTFVFPSRRDFFRGRAAQADSTDTAKARSDRHTLHESAQRKHLQRLQRSLTSPNAFRHYVEGLLTSDKNWI